MNGFERISAQEFVAYLMHGAHPARCAIPSNPTERPVEVYGNVDLAGETIKGSRVAYGVTFHGDLDFSNCVVEGTIDFSACVLEGTLRFDDAEIRGSLRLNNAAILGDMAALDRAAGTEPLVPSGLVLRGVGAVVRGRLDLANARVSGDVGLMGIDVNGFLDLRGLTAASVRMQGAVVHGDVRLGCNVGRHDPTRVLEVNASDIQIFGRLTVHGGIVPPDWIHQATTRSRLVFSDARVEGSVLIAPFFPANRRIDFHSTYPAAGWRNEDFIPPELGNLLFDNASVQGSFRIICGDIRYLSANYMTVGGVLMLGHDDAHAARFDTPETDAAVNSVTRRLQPDVRHSNRLHMDSLSVYGASIGGLLSVQGVQFEGEVDLRAIQCLHVECRSVPDARMEIEGDLLLDAARVTSYLQLSGVIVARQVALHNATVGGVSFVPMIADDSGGYDAACRGRFVPCQFGHLSIRNSTVGASIDLSHVQVMGTPSYTTPGIVIQKTRIGARLTLWSPYAFQHADGRWFDADHLPWHFAATVAGDVHVHHCVIGGDCVLTFAKVSGVIDLSDSEVIGDLKIASTLSQPSSDLGVHVRDALRTLPPLEPAYRTTCSRLVLRMLRCSNDADLTGLTIVAPRSDDEIRQGIGCLSAPYLEVKGDLHLYETFPQDAPSSFAPALIPGCLDLSDARIRRVVLSAYGFPMARVGGHSRLRCETEGVLLTRAELDVLEIPDLLGDPGRYPKPIDLEDIKVRVWRIGQRVEDASHTEVARRYCELLRNAPAFRRSTYKAVEATLRNGGDDGAADLVYRAMMDRAHDVRQREPSVVLAMWRRTKLWQKTARLVTRPPQWLRMTVWRSLLAYGTNASPLIVCILTLIACSIPVYRNPANFETSLAYLAAHPGWFPATVDRPTRDAPPALESWGGSTVLMLTLHYHVPVVPLVVRNDWEAKDAKPVFYGGTVKCEPISSAGLFARCQPGHEDVDEPLFVVNAFAPEDYVTLIELLNWILWPLLLAYTIRRVLRQ